ncbi:MAG: homocysteine S-methyltransferase family protein [Alistipes inops]
MLPYLKRMADIAECRYRSINAGLPNLAGEYEESPETMAVQMEEYFRQGLVNIAGGCCGTTPDHIRAVAEAARRYPPRPLPVPRHRTMLAGLEPLVVDETTGFVSVGEHTNVAGSAKFARLIREGRFEEALAVARNQIEGAHRSSTSVSTTE